MNGPILITGAAGFIGSTLTDRLLAAGRRVVGVDNLCDFYDPAVKRRNLAGALGLDQFEMMEADIRDGDAIDAVFARVKPESVVHLAAMAGVRPSIENPALYVAVNVDGTMHVLDAAVKHGVGRFVFASSSSVYGNNQKVPFAEDDPVDFPISPYAATKRAGELICHTYWHLHHLPVACLRLFTVYGPRQRPDLAIGKFLRLVEAGAAIPVFGDGSMSRDFTFVGDIVDGMLAALERCDAFGIYNLGGNHPVTLTDLIGAIEQVVGKRAKIDRQPQQPGDVERTYADLTRSSTVLGYEPRVSLEQGIGRQWEWVQSQ
ncbi:MAG: epimerase [Planctomycetaceae bacterium]|nr:epimerase [Planctomycetaceae bacterium]